MSTATRTRMLVTIFESLSNEKAMQLFDFARFLKETPSLEPATSSRGSAESILNALNEIGKLEFGPGELNDIMSDIDEMRQFDLEMMNA